MFSVSARRKLGEQAHTPNLTNTLRPGNGNDPGGKLCQCQGTTMVLELSRRHGASSGRGWRVAANKLNKQPRTVDEGWSSSLGVGRGANNASPWKPMLRNTHKSRCFLWRQNDPEVNYSPTRISVGGSVSRGSIMQQATEKGQSWLRIGTGGGHLWVWWGTFGFQKCGEFFD